MSAKENFEVIFRGVAKVGVTVYGSYKFSKSIGSHYIIVESGYFIEIHPESLAMWTGETDKNGVKIFGGIGTGKDKGGDVIRCHEYDSSDTGRGIVQTFNSAVVAFINGSYYYFPNGNMRVPHQLLINAHKPEVIGNAFLNPELLEV